MFFASVLTVYWFAEILQPLPPRSGGGKGGEDGEENVCLQVCMSVGEGGVEVSGGCQMFGSAISTSFFRHSVCH